MHYDMKKSGERIRQLRIRVGYSQGELARALNVDQGFLSRVESGKKGCSVDLFVQLSALLGVSLDVLILGMDEIDLLKEERRTQLKTDIEELINQLTQFQARL